MTKGLTTAQAQEKARRGLSNVAVDNTAKTSAQIVRDNIFTYFNLIFTVLAVLLIAAGSFKNLTFMIVVVANTVIGIAQQLRAKKILDDLKVMNQPSCHAYRDGVVREIATTQLVPEDIIILSEGVQIPADAVVISGEIAVNESLLTGEADEIEKKEGSALMSGSFVVNGRCEAKVTKVGLDSYINRISMRAKQMEGSEQSEMVRSINRFVIAAGIAIVPIGIVLYYQSYSRGYSYAESIVGVVAAVVGMIPEGLYLLVSVALALSAMRLALNKVMLHDMKSTETLARVDVLCVDKTGTITENRMEVVSTLLPVSSTQGASSPNLNDSSRVQSVSGEAHSPASRAIPQAVSQIDKKNLTYASNIMYSYISSLPDDNATMRALREYFNGRVKKRALDALPFSSKRKYSAVTFDEGTFLLGAPDILLGNNYETYREQIEAFANKGLRVIVLAREVNDSVSASDYADSAFPNAEPIMLVTLNNPLRSGAEETFAFFEKQGVEIRVISGDNPVTVSRVAKRAGIPGAERYIDATKITSQTELNEAIGGAVVFGRVTPDMKKDIVNALKDAGHTVAMTGDGVNDILAMKDADCSIAMAAGSDAAIQAAQVVLLDSDFSKMPGIVAEGRRDINNIERSATLFLVKNIFSFLLSLYTIFSISRYPLEPTQISLVSMFNIGLPAFLLAMEPNNRRITGHFIRKVAMRAMPAAITDFVIIATMVRFGDVFGVASNDIGIASTYLLAIVGFMILYRISKPMNRFRVAVMLICVAGLILFSYLFNDLYSVGLVSKKCFMLFTVFAIVTEPFMRYLTLLFEKIDMGIGGHGKKKKSHGDKVKYFKNPGDPDFD